MGESSLVPRLFLRKMGEEPGYEARGKDVW